MDAATSQMETLLHLEARHVELLQRLEDLNKRVDRVLAECLPAPALPSGITSAGPDGQTC